MSVSSDVRFPLSGKLFLLAAEVAPGSVRITSILWHQLKIDIYCAWSELKQLGSWKMIAYKAAMLCGAFNPIWWLTTFYTSPRSKEAVKAKLIFRSLYSRSYGLSQTVSISKTVRNLCTGS
jgi:hypothetical protein